MKKLVIEKNLRWLELTKQEKEIKQEKKQIKAFYDEVLKGDNEKIWKDLILFIDSVYIKEHVTKGYYRNTYKVKSI